MLQQKKLVTVLATLCLISSVSAFADTNENYDEPAMTGMPAPQCVAQQDPYEGYNRRMYSFNKHVDCYVLKPVAQTYRKILPWPITTAISNFFSNISNIPAIINDILQGSLYYTAHDTTRLVINTVFGLGGIIDVASHGNLHQHSNDFGLTMAHWGYCSSSYFIVPFIGPSTMRDTLAIPVDYGAFSPYLYAFPLLGAGYAIQYGIAGVYVVDKRAQFLDFDQVMKEAAVDPYIFERDAYLQHRDAMIANNNDMDGNKDAKDPFSDDVLVDTNNSNAAMNHQHQKTVDNSGFLYAEKTNIPHSTNNSQHGLLDREQNSK